MRRLLSSRKNDLRCGNKIRLLAVIAFALGAIRRFSHAWIPPHPSNRDGFETVHAMRRRLSLPFNYSSVFINPELCRYLTEEECEETDKMMEKHVKAHKQLQKQIQYNPSLGKINVLVLMVRFSDHTDRDRRY